MKSAADLLNHSVELKTKTLLDGEEDLFLKQESEEHPSSRSMVSLTVFRFNLDC